MNNDKRYYNKDRLFSYKAFLNFSVGARGTGKTTCGKFWCVDDFLRTGKRFVWVRRYNTELTGDKKKGIEGCVKDFFPKIQKFYPNHKFEVKRNHAYIDGKDAGVFIALSTSSAMKSVDFPDVNKIIFDEFLITKGSKYTYLNNELTIFLDLISTVFRPITDEFGKEAYKTTVWCLSNAITFANDYFYYFNIKPFHTQFYHDKNRGIAVEQYVNETYEEAVRKTSFGKLISGTDYEDYAVDNQYMLDNNDFILPKSKNAVFLFNVRYEGHKWGVYADSQYVYVTNRVDTTQPFFVFTKADHSLDSLMIKSIRGTRFEVLIRNYQLGLVMFDNLMIKKKFIDFISLFVIK